MTANFWIVNQVDVISLNQLQSCFWSLNSAYSLLVTVQQENLYLIQLFEPLTAYYQYPWQLPEDHGKDSEFIDQEEVRQMKVNAVERLSSISAREREDMRRYVVYEVLPELVYGDSSSRFEDAISITVNTCSRGLAECNEFYIITSHKIGKHQWNIPSVFK